MSKSKLKQVISELAWQAGRRLARFAHFVHTIGA